MMLMVHKMRPGLKIMLAALGVFGLLVPGAALATTQFSEILYLDGQKHALESLPLEPYYGPGNPRPKFRAPTPPPGAATSPPGRSTGASFSLKAIRAWIDGREVGLETLFPGQHGPVAATWFTGKLKVPQGKVLKPAVPYPIYEKYLMITVEKGRVVSRAVIDNPQETRLPGI